MECEPWASDDVVNEAEPLASATAPNTVVPSRN
jgi:hypothetical protein